MKILILLSIIALSGCASSQPKMRVIDATNSAPWFQRSSETTESKDYHQDATNKDTGKLEKHKAGDTAKTTTIDFTF